MLTQCPHCLTLFRVGPEHLKAAAGRVRCCRCHQVFNALESLHESPTPFVNSPELSSEPDPAPQIASAPVDASTEPAQDTQPQMIDDTGWREPTDQSSDESFTPMLPDLEPADTADEFDDILEQDDGLAPEPDYFASGSESQMSELLDQDTSSILLPDSEQFPEQSPEPLPDQYQQEPREPAGDNIVAFSTAPAKTTPDETEPAPDVAGADLGEIHDLEQSILTDEAIDEELGKPDYDSVPAFRLDTETYTETADKVQAETPTVNEEQALNFEAVATEKPARRTHLPWLIGSLLLLLPLTGQILWQFRHDLMQHDAGRQTLSLLCQVAGCQVPVRRALDKLVIQGRNLSTHPDKPEALFLQVSLVNTAPFEQPFPGLTLSLFNDKGNLIARRTFSADDYLPPDIAAHPMMPRAQPILVEMELVDPGSDVTGFSFDFH